MRRILSVLLLSVFLAACAPQAPSIDTSNLPAGDAVAGEALFQRSIGSLSACTQCHSLDGSRGTGPTLQHFGETLKSRPGGTDDALTYVMGSIITPGSYVVNGYSNVMPPAYGQVLSRQQLADLIAYLLTL